MDITSLKAAIDSVDVVSFDVFDTLIIRNVGRPADVFALCAESCGLSTADEFASARIAAEKAARDIAHATGSEEVTLAQIYTVLSEAAQPALWPLQQLMQAEQEIEGRVCRAHPVMHAAYQYAAGRGKQLVIASDMYLSQACVEEILQHASYTSHAKLYLSSELGSTKRTGALFRHMLQDLDIKHPHRVLHVGDNPHSDGAMAAANGLKTFLISPVDEIFKQSIHGKRHGADRQAGPMAKAEHGLFANRMAQQSSEPFSDIGYFYFGPILAGLAAWVIQAVKLAETEHTYFLARDGHVIHQAIELLRALKVHALSTSYLFASRRSLIIPSITTVDDKALDFLTSGSSSLPVGDYLQRAGVNPEAHLSIIKAAGFHGAQDVVDSPVKKEYLRRLVQEVQSPILQAAQAEAYALKKYLQQNGAGQHSRIALVDIGWHGSMQEALVEVFARWNWDVQVQGLYLGTFPPAAARIKAGLHMQSFVMHCGLPVAACTTIKESVEIFEWFFSAPHGSVLGFEQGAAGGMQPILENPTFENSRLNSAALAQAGALAYVRDLLSVIGTEVFLHKQNQPHDCLKMIGKLLAAPTTQEAKLLGDIPHVEGFGATSTPRPIAQPTGHILNPMHWQKIRNEYSRCHWKSGFRVRALQPLLSPF